MSKTVVLFALTVGLCSALRLNIRPATAGTDLLQIEGSEREGGEGRERGREGRLRTKNVFDPWQCTKPYMKHGSYLRAKNREWPIEEFQNMRDHRKATVFFNPSDAKLYYKSESEAGPFCPTDADFFAKQGTLEEDKFGLDYAMDLIRKGTKNLTKIPDNGDPVIMVDVKHLNEAVPDTLSNTLCSLKRVGLLDRTVVFLGAPTDNGKLLQKAFPEVSVVEDKLFKVAEKNDHRGLHANFNWRWVPILALLELGYPTMHLDPDVHVIKDPRSFLESQSEADVISTYEQCLDLNGGVNFFRSNERAKDMVRQMLAMEHELEEVQIDDGSYVRIPAEGDDQWALTCAASYGVVNGMKLKMLTAKEAVFQVQITDFFKRNCYGKGATLEEFPYFVHTAQTNSEDRPGRMKLLGLLEKEENGGIGQCIENHDPTAQCNAGLTFPEDEMTLRIFGWDDRLR